MLSCNNEVISEFKIGDTVVVRNDKSTVQELQKGHGGWNDDMDAILGKQGKVKLLLPNGDIYIDFGGNKWSLNPLCLTSASQSSGAGERKGSSSDERGDMLLQLLLAAAAAAAAESHSEKSSSETDSEKSTKKLAVGDSVRILDDIDRVRELQSGHGEWVDSMATSLGKTGKVVHLDADGDVKVLVQGDLWTFNPMCLTTSSGLSREKSFGLNGMSLLSAAVSGNADDVREILKANPGLIDAQVSNKSALHCAVAKDHISVLKVLLEFNPNLEIKDEDGDTPLHLTAFRDREEIVELLLNAGANINAKNKKGITPLMIASAKGQTKVMKLYLKTPSIDLQQQDADGDTALHIAVGKDQSESIALLLDAGAIPGTKNDNGFSAMHDAAKQGKTAAVELFVRYTPQSINNQKEDGFTMLHLAALNNNILVVNALAASEHCDLNIYNGQKQTALHIALMAKSLRIAEQLVGYGADLNVVDKDGDTPLHYAFVLPSMGSVSPDTPQLSKIRDALKPKSKLPTDETTISRLVWACFLIQEGANIEVKNLKGKSALQLCNQQVADIIMQFKGKGSFHGVLKRKQAPSTAKIEAFDNDIELQGKLGEGGQGAVYKAVIKKTGQIIAAKKMNVGSIISAEKELSTMKSLKHKNIVQLFGVAKDSDGGILILMELATDSLYGVLKKSSPEIKKSMNWATQVAQGMRYLHYEAPQTILHGDLKSPNVLSFSNGVVKISDFGCSKVFNVTHATSAAISILWSAPELFSATQRPNLACDVYSFGILLWEMFTHKQPYEGMSLAAILSKVVNENMRPEVPSTCPDSVSGLMMKCWDSDPKKRPTFEIIAQVLEEGKPKASGNSLPTSYEVEAINDIELKEKIGSGCSGVVLKAHWKSKNIDVAVKKIHIKSQEAILKEVAIMKTVRHKNIVRFYNICQDADQNYLMILELADNSLDKELPKLQPNIKRTLNWAIQVARGMSYLHYDAPEAIIHGDMKSMNVLTFPGDVVKISDFGSAKYFEVTRQTSISVTYAWSAPELFKKKQIPNLSCDVYSYGIVFWEMLTHKVPYADLDSPQILFAVSSGERPEIPPTCPEVLAKLMQMCWDGVPKQRPTFKTVLRTLEDAEEKLA
eukprot:Em0017g635a